MTTIIDIDPVIANLESREWIQGEEQKGEAVCAHGAVQTCQQLQPGDEHIVRAVMRHKGLTEKWNDTEGRTKAEVLDRFRSVEVSDVVLAEMFGPQWESIVALIRRIAVLTDDEAGSLAAAWGGARTAAWATSRDSALDVARYASRDSALDVARYASRDSALDVARYASRDATHDAAWALVVRDLIGRCGFEQHHYDTLVRSWARVVGPAHPDDEGTAEGEQ